MRCPAYAVSSSKSVSVRFRGPAVSAGSTNSTIGATAAARARPAVCPVDTAAGAGIASLGAASALTNNHKTARIFAIERLLTNSHLCGSSYCALRVCVRRAPTPNLDALCGDARPPNHDYNQQLIHPSTTRHISTAQTADSTR